jgi:hypothetical protein
MERQGHAAASPPGKKFSTNVKTWLMRQWLERRLALTLRTCAERIIDESLIGIVSLFVHCIPWWLSRPWTQDVVLNVRRNRAPWRQTQSSR